MVGTVSGFESRSSGSGAVATGAVENFAANFLEHLPEAFLFLRHGGEFAVQFNHADEISYFGMFVDVGEDGAGKGRNELVEDIEGDAGSGIFGCFVVVVIHAVR